MREGWCKDLMFLLSESTVLVVTLWVWFHGPAGEEVTHCIVANVQRHLAKLEEIPGERREEGREVGRRGGREEGEERERRGKRDWGEREEEEEGESSLEGVLHQ